MSRIRLPALVTGILLVCAVSRGGAVPERVREYHVLHYALDLRVDGRDRSVAGTVSMRLVPLRPLSTLSVDAAGLSIERVTLTRRGATDRPLDVRPAAAAFSVSLPREMTPADTIALIIAYTAHPRTGLFFVQPDSAYPDRPAIVWSQGEMEQNHYWFPCYDYPNDKATCEMRVTVNEHYRAISNGALLSVTPHPEQKTVTYFWYQAKPIVSYLISLVVGEYDEITERYKTIPVEYNIYPRWKDDAMRSFSKTPEMIRFFSDKTGFDYPWAKYAQTVVPCFTYGGMENASATTLTDATIHSARAHLDVRSEGLVAHELAHQWFGDLLTCRSWSHAWLNEGFATYFQTLFDEKDLGRDDYDEEMMAHQAAVVAADRGDLRRATVTSAYLDPEDVFDAHIYARGACILQMLRFIVGEKKFWEGIRHYVDLYQYQCVSTDDFRRAMEDVAHEDLRWFFDEWTVHAGYPAFEVVPEYDDARRVMHLDIRQTQQVDSLTPLFRMPVAVEVSTDSGSVVRTITVSAAREQRVDIPCPLPPRNIVFDKGNWILKTLAITKPAEMWLYQLEHGSVPERRSALTALAGMMPRADVLAAVEMHMRQDPFWSVRQQAAGLVAMSGADNALRLLAPAFNDPDARVRAVATAGLKHFRTLDALVALGNIFASDSSEAVVAEAVLSLAAIDSAHAMSYCEKGFSMDSHRDIIRCAAIKAMGALRTEQSRERLLALTRYGQAIDVRLAAIDALADHWRADPPVRPVVEQLVHDPLFQVQRKTVERLDALEDAVTAHRILRDMIDQEIQPLLRREARRTLARLDRRSHTPGQ